MGGSVATFFWKLNQPIKSATTTTVKPQW